MIEDTATIGLDEAIKLASICARKKTSVRAVMRTEKINVPRVQDMDRVQLSAILYRLSRMSKFVTDGNAKFYDVRCVTIRDCSHLSPYGSVHMERIKESDPPELMPSALTLCGHTIIPDAVFRLSGERCPACHERSRREGLAIMEEAFP